MPTPTNPAEYCRSLRELVQKGIYDFHTANAMWQNYRKSLQMFGVDPGPCTLGPEGPTQPVIDAGGDGGFSLAGPDAAYGVRDAMAAFDPTSWVPTERPQINMGFDPYARGGTDFGPGGGFGFDTPFPSSRGPDAPRESAPAEPAASQPRPPPEASGVPTHAQARVEMRVRDGTFPYIPRPFPQPQPAAAGPSPYEGVPVTRSFGIRDS